MSDIGHKIIEGLKEALAGNLARVTIDGVTWVRKEELRRKDAEIERLRATLKPFADAADLAERNLCKHNTDEILIRLGRLREARAALTASEAENPTSLP